MALMLESEVLARHLPLFADKRVFLFGNVRDNFADQVAKSAQSTWIFTQYFDFFKQANSMQTSVQFHLESECCGDLAVFYWLKNKQECQYLLYQWLVQAAPLGQQMLIVGENRAGVKSVEKMLAPYGELAKIDSARRCSLYHFTLTQYPPFEAKRYWKRYQTADIAVWALPAVFSSAELDAGTALLLSTFSPNDTLKGKVLDLGCGAGVIGATLKKRYPHIELLMSDIHAMAEASSRRTLTENALDGEVYVSDVFSELDWCRDVALIVSNPPFHDGIDTDYRAVETLIVQAKQHLRKGGELRIVANSHLPYPALLDRAFGSHSVLAKSTKFKVYSAKA